jgi:hypothetical protein
MDKNLRNALLIGGGVVAVIVVLGFINTILSSIVPLAIVAVIAFILGRLSTRMNLLQAAGGVISGALRMGRAISETTSTPAAQTETKKQPVQKVEPAAPPERLAEEIADDAPESDDSADSLDFAIKTQDELQAEARRLEEKVAARSSDYDARAAIEERKRRLLGNADEKQ